jgi:ketosteroid isomerase-like protein
LQLSINQWPEGLNPKTKKVTKEKGKYLTIFKKQSDGTWKAIEDSISNDAPPTPAK